MSCVVVASGMPESLLLLLLAFRRPRIRGGTPGLFFAGGGTHPGGGVPLVMLSGRFAAEMASEHLRRSA